MNPAELGIWEKIAELTERMAATEAAAAEFREASLALMSSVAKLAELRAGAVQGKAPEADS